jgi:hypothetical protein
MNSDQHEINPPYDLTTLSRIPVGKDVIHQQSPQTFPLTGEIMSDHDASESIRQCIHKALDDSSLLSGGTDAIGDNVNVVDLNDDFVLLRPSVLAQRIDTDEFLVSPTRRRPTNPVHHINSSSFDMSDGDDRSYVTLDSAKAIRNLDSISGDGCNVSPLNFEDTPSELSQRLSFKQYDSTSSGGKSQLEAKRQKGLDPAV